MRDLDLPSGKKLHIQVAKFLTGKALFQAFSDELKGMKIATDTDIDVSLLKDLLCTAVSSKKIEAALWECFKTVTVDGLKIDTDTFEPVDMRADYFIVALEVAKDNLLPFTKHLMPLFSALLGKAKDSLKLKYPTNPEVTS